jgi:hypothetical protein
MQPAAGGTATTNNVGVTSDLIPSIAGLEASLELIRAYVVPSGTINLRYSILSYDASGTYISQVDYEGNSSASSSIADRHDLVDAALPVGSAYIRLEVVIWETGFDAGTYFQLGLLVATQHSPSLTLTGSLTVPSLSLQDAIYDGGGASGTSGGLHLRDSSAGASSNVHGLMFGPGAAGDTKLWRSGAGAISTDASLAASGAVSSGSTISVPSGELLRYVPLATYIQAVADGSTANATVSKTHVAEMTTLPAGAVAVLVFVESATSALALSNYVDVYDYGGSNAFRCHTPGVASYTNSITAIVLLGGTNNHQFDYMVNRPSAGTITYSIRVMGYFTKL